MPQMTLPMIMAFMFGAAPQIADPTSNEHDDVQEIHPLRVELAIDLSPYHVGRSPIHEEAPLIHANSFKESNSVTMVAWMTVTMVPSRE